MAAGQDSTWQERHNVLSLATPAAATAGIRRALEVWCDPNLTQYPVDEDVLWAFLLGCRIPNALAILRQNVGVPEEVLMELLEEERDAVQRLYEESLLVQRPRARAFLSPGPGDPTAPARAPSQAQRWLEEGSRRRDHPGAAPASPLTPPGYHGYPGRGGREDPGSHHATAAGSGGPAPWRRWAPTVPRGAAGLTGPPSPEEEETADLAGRPPPGWERGGPVDPLWEESLRRPWRAQPVERRSPRSRSPPRSPGSWRDREAGKGGRLAPTSSLWARVGHAPRSPTGPPPPRAAAPGRTAAASRQGRGPQALPVPAPPAGAPPGGKGQGAGAREPPPAGAPGGRPRPAPRPKGQGAGPAGPPPPRPPWDPPANGLPRGAPPNPPKVGGAAPPCGPVRRKPMTDEELGFASRDFPTDPPDTGDPKGNSWSEKLHAWLHKCFQFTNFGDRHRRWAVKEWTKEGQKWRVHWAILPRTEESGGREPWEREVEWSSAPYHRQRLADEDVACQVLMHQWRAGRLPFLTWPASTPLEAQGPKAPPGLDPPRPKPKAAVPVAKKPRAEDPPPGSLVAALLRPPPPQAVAAAAAPPPAGGQEPGGDPTRPGGEAADQAKEEPGAPGSSVDRGGTSPPGAQGGPSSQPSSPHGPAAAPSTPGEDVAMDQQGSDDFLQPDPDWLGGGVEGEIDPVAEAARRAVERCSQPAPAAPPVAPGAADVPGPPPAGLAAEVKEEEEEDAPADAPSAGAGGSEQG